MPDSTPAEHPSGLIRPEAINEFRQILTVSSVAAATVESLRRADERTQLEPALMRIIGEVDETPHGPTEVADIVSVRLQLLGKPVFAQVVIKGRARSTVRSADVSHQLTRAARQSGVGLLILAAVGDIQDDAKVELGWLSSKIGACWTVLDRESLARLLIAYGELCPRDGSWLVGKPCPVCGYRPSTRKAIARPPYTILTLEDVSTALAKRFGIHLLVPPGLSDDEVEHRVRLAVPSLRAQGYARNRAVAEHHAGRLADVLFLFIYEDATDRPFANWICRALWVSANLPKIARPLEYGTADAVEPALRIEWSATHAVLVDLLSDRLEKGAYLESIDRFAEGARVLVEWARSLLGRASATGNEAGLSSLEAQVAKLHRPDRQRTAPHELMDLDDAFEALDADLMNIGLPYGKRGVESWPDAARRLWLASQAIDRYSHDRRRFELEREKVR